MIRKSLYQVFLVMVIVFVSIFYMIDQQYQQQIDLTRYQQNIELSNIQLEIRRIIESHDWDEFNATKRLIDLVKDIPYVTAVKTTKKQKNIHRREINKSDENLMVLSYYLPTKEQQTILFVSLNISITPPLTDKVNNVVLFLIIIFTFIAFVVYKFTWLFQLEEYAKHLLTSENNFDLKSKNNFHNVIGHAMNQLILNNSYLTKTKTELVETIRKTSYIDDVTDIGNHLFFKAELQVRLHNHEESESGLVVILSFVENDELQLSGSQQVQIANVLKSFVDDISQALVARLKEREFALLLPNITSAQLDSFCKKLIDQLGQSIFNTTVQKQHFVDIGVSSYKQGFGYYNIMSEADMALRNAQLQADNNWFIYGEPLPQHKSKGRLKWRNFLQDILDQRNILLYSQTINYFKDSTIFHREILARILDGNEILLADRFLVMASQSGLAADFDRQIIDGMIKYLLFQDDNVSEHRYSINIFTSSLLEPKFTHWLLTKLSSYPALAKQLIIEIPERLMSKHLEKLLPIMHQVSKLGVLWCVEHFGAPENDFSYLDRAPIYMVKVDRRIIYDIANDKPKQLLLASIIVNMRDRKIKIFAEGVEKKSDVDYLINTDIDGGQGYYFDKPKRLSSVERRLKVV